MSLQKLAVVAAIAIALIAGAYVALQTDDSLPKINRMLQTDENVGRLVGQVREVHVRTRERVSPSAGSKSSRYTLVVTGAKGTAAVYLRVIYTTDGTNIEEIRLESINPLGTAG